VKSKLNRALPLLALMSFSFAGQIIMVAILKRLERPPQDRGFGFKSSAQLIARTRSWGTNERSIQEGSMQLLSPTTQRRAVGSRASCGAWAAGRRRLIRRLASPRLAAPPPAPSGVGNGKQRIWYSPPFGRLPTRRRRWRSGKPSQRILPSLTVTTCQRN